MGIKKLLILIVVAMSLTDGINAGAPPTVMFLPDKTWCTQNGFVDVSERNGKTRYTEKYEEAFLMSPELKDVIVQLNALMQDNGLKAKDYMTTSELDDEEEMEEAMYEGEDGGEVQMTAYEAALNKLRPDIIIKIGWDLHQVGFNKSISYRLEALDSYSGKSVAQVTSETAPFKSNNIAGPLKNAATEQMPLFISRLQEHFDDLQENGREITIALRTSNNSGINFNTDFGGKELSTIISDWVNDNTVNNSYSTRSSSRNRINFEQVRIPFKDANGRVMQAKEYVDQLKNYLRAHYNISSENTTKGLGTGRLYNITN